MPIKVPDHLPAKEKLKQENIFVMDESRAYRQDIRPLKIIILNLMPLKEKTETQLLRLLANSPLQIDVYLLHTNSYTSQNTPHDHLSTFYKTFEDVRSEKYDGLIITGAPIEKLDFEQVTYWEELTDIMEWSLTNVTSTLHLCWGALAGLYHHHGVSKQNLEEKIFGVFTHHTNESKAKLLSGFDEEFLVPHSRYADLDRNEITSVPGLEILSESKKAGVYIVTSKNGKQIYVTGHPEYDAFTLKEEYERDKNKGLQTKLPENYFPENDDSQCPRLRWRSHSNMLISNWLNYYVYQETPYILE
ncbi:homoserine O-succinyltransferase [Aquibacillus koreensis]|uniref:Homoserine O-acetyltransferase n=1 Tax=Aquibacillus koreensis TaxID=279446 RepID=A0A9X4AL42_9BACI|nr:homoserine O-succinyltransferase [Aquibacillus koreensis]MCT2536123.1 homoserine O-succinyltransferase [Aquibacillus koreensis]MDC3422048.1 homoserine O-succinyltransferase [Aquibacillus koreensis]